MGICELCGGLFKLRTDRIQRFCSVSCANRARRKNFPKPCIYCGNIFQAPRSHSKQKYCSTACRDLARTTRKEVACSQCGKKLIRLEKRVKKEENFFCSPECTSKWKISHSPRGPGHPQYKERVKVVCDTCGKMLEKVPSKLRKHNFCNPECRTIWQRTSGYSMGKNSPSWRGGCSEYRGPDWDRQRRLALARDNYQCQDCGVIGVLQVHHLLPYQTFEDYRKANSLDNLISLCNRCHQIADWRFRKDHPTQLCAQPRNEHLLYCRECGKGFVSRGPRALRCEECWQRVCPQCGKRFRPPLWHIKFCSVKCAAAFRSTSSLQDSP